MAACIAVSGLMAAEHHGAVKSGGLAVPGATVTATQGDKKMVTTTDDQGDYSFPELADGTWTIDVEMLGFAKLTRDVGIASDAPAADWDLKLLPPGANLAPTPPAAAAPAPVTPAPATVAPAPVTPAPATVAPAAPPAAAATKKAAPAAKTQARGNQTPARGTQAANGGRPSLTQAMAGYQRVDVNATEGGAAAGAENGMGNEQASADLNQSAADSLLVNGSMSSGVGMAQQNDWFGGPGGMGMGGPGMMGMGGPGGMGGDNPGGAAGAGDFRLGERDEPRGVEGGGGQSVYCGAVFVDGD